MTEVLYRDGSPVCHRCGKIAYPKRRGAIRKMKMLERKSGKQRRASAREGPVDAYPCPDGNGWHIGHRKRLARLEHVVTPVGRSEDADE